MINWSSTVQKLKNRLSLFLQRPRGSQTQGRLNHVALGEQLRQLMISLYQSKTFSQHDWLLFYDLALCVEPELSPNPLVKKPSLLPSLGFKDFDRFICAPISEGGIGFDLKKWEALKQAKKVHVVAPWFFLNGFSYLSISNIAAQASTKGVSLPESNDELSQFLDSVN
ncbi:TPA: hypothetical protein ACPIAT_006622 [Pseudomonas aeruginosa]|uniref:hypothetical protein n=1 Tax=Pseudomonas sp. On1 TaxID=3083258 RepID=UPI0029B75F84|nr:hypothetical protein [Pseudomonas sp. On1]MDX2310065.1 hypothetical protein [Pseudomonas sp. On1]